MDDFEIKQNEITSEFIAELIFNNISEYLQEQEQPKYRCVKNDEFKKLHIKLIIERIESPQNINDISEFCNEENYSSEKKDNSIDYQLWLEMDYSCCFCQLFVTDPTLLCLVLNCGRKIYEYDTIDDKLNITIMRCIIFLIKRGADINCVNRYHYLSVLFAAGLNNNIAMFYFLIKQGADINKQFGINKHTIFHYFSKFFNLYRLKSPETYIQDKYNIVYIDTQPDDITKYSVVSKYISIGEILQEANIDVTIQDRYLNTPFDFAYDVANMSLLEFILNEGWIDLHSDEYGEHIIDNINDSIELCREKNYFGLLKDHKLCKKIIKKYYLGGGIATKSANDKV